jgi:hypothetical protein
MRWLSTLCLLAVGAAVFADDKPKSSKVTAHPTGLYIRKPLPPKKKEAFFFTPNGTTLDVTLAAPSKFVVGIDEKASKLESFTDDKKTKLDTSTGFGMQPWLSSYPQISPDGDECTVQLSARTAPAKGASKVLVKATVVINCGKEEKTSDKKEIATKLNTEAKVGAYTVKVTQEGNQFSGGQISIFSNARDLKSAEFFDDKGKEIKILGNPFRGSTFTGPGKMQHSLSYFLPKKLDKVTVKVTYFNKIESVNVPLDLSVGLGLE